MKLEFLSTNEADTIIFGERLAAQLMESDVICLSGELGVGKTRLVKGIAKGLGINPNIVRSPTFVLMNMYEGKLPLYHFDFYRMNEDDEMSFVGYDDFFYGEGVSVIEWPQRLGNVLPPEHLDIEIFYQEGDIRLIKIRALGKRYQRMLSYLFKIKRELREG